MMRLIFAVMFIVAFNIVNTCAAADVWIDHWNSENLDIYAMDDTIQGGTSDTGKYFSVSSKMVADGKIQRVVKWTFSKFRDDMWRYETSTMDGTHTTVVIPRNLLFEFCMDKLGWSYRITNDGGIRYYH